MSALSRPKAIILRTAIFAVVGIALDWFFSSRNVDMASVLRRVGFFFLFNVVYELCTALFQSRGK